jgi:hypothetical protein
LVAYFKLAVSTSLSRFESLPVRAHIVQVGIMDIGGGVRFEGQAIEYMSL